MRQPDDVGVAVLRNLGVELDKVRSTVELILGRGEESSPAEIGLTPRAKKVIELALEEARRLNHNYIGTEHLLLGLVREGEGIAFGVLESLGATLDRVRTEITRIPYQPRPSASTRPLDPELKVHAIESCRAARTRLLNFEGNSLENLLIREFAVPALDSLRDLVDGSGATRLSGEDLTKLAPATALREVAKGMRSAGFIEDAAALDAALEAVVAAVAR